MECDDHNDEKGLVEYNCERNKSSPPPPPFLLKTCMLVEDPSTDEIISWNEDGTAFVVWQPAEFSRDLLPTVFKHSNFSSFVRQLNTYGFRKVATDRWEFKNDKFRRGKGDQLCGIRRRKPCSSSSNKPNPNPTASQAQLLEHHHIAEDQRTSSTTSSSELAILLDENKRLRQENGALSSELNGMKKKCKELSDLLATYGSKSTDGDDMEEEFEVEDGCNNSNIGPKLFGVRLQVKGEIDHYQKDDHMSES